MCFPSSLQDEHLKWYNLKPCFMTSMDVFSGQNSLSEMMSRTKIIEDGGWEIECSEQCRYR